MIRKDQFESVGYILKCNLAWLITMHLLLRTTQGCRRIRVHRTIQCTTTTTKHLKSQMIFFFVKEFFLVKEKVVSPLCRNPNIVNSSSQRESNACGGSCSRNPFTIGPTQQWFSDDFFSGLSNHSYQTRGFKQWICLRLSGLILHSN